MRIYRKYRLIPQEYNDNNKIWYTVVGFFGSRGCGFVICVVWVWGCIQALNWLKINRLFWRKMIWTTRTTRSGLGKLLTLIDYSRELPKISEARHPLYVTTPTDTCLKRSVFGLQLHQQKKSQWYQRFKLVTKLQI